MKRRADAESVYDNWLDCRRRHNPKTQKVKISDKDRKALQALLASGRTVDELKLAVEGLFQSPHHLGENDRHTPYLAFEFVLRSKNVDAFIALAEESHASLPPPSEAKPDGPIVPPPPAFRAYLERQRAKAEALQAELPVAASADVRWTPKAAGSPT